MGLIVAKSYVIPNWRTTAPGAVVLFRGFAPVSFISPPNYIVAAGRLRGGGSYVEGQASVVPVPALGAGALGLRLPELALFTTTDSDKPEAARWSFAFYDAAGQLLERWRAAQDVRLSPEMGEVVTGAGGRPDRREAEWDKILLAQPALRQKYEPA